MRRIAALLATVTLLGGLAGVHAAGARGATLPIPSPAPSAAAACAQPRLLILSAFPAEMGKMMRATKLDSTEPVSPRGVALAASPLRDGAGPLYDPQRADELGPTLTDVLRELDQAIESEPSG